MGLLSIDVNRTFNEGLVPWACLHCEWPMLHVLLYHWIAEVSADEALGVEHSVTWVHCHLVLCRVTNETLSICRQKESHRSVTFPELTEPMEATGCQPFC